MTGTKVLARFETLAVAASAAMLFIAACTNSPATETGSPSTTPSPAPAPSTGTAQYPYLDYAVGYLGSEADLIPLTAIPAFGAAITYSSATKRIRITTAGTVMDGYDIRGAFVTVEASNVTIKNCLADASANPYYIIDQYAGNSGLTVENCTFDGLKLDNVTAAMITGRNETLTVRDCVFKNAPADMVKLTKGTVTRSYFIGGGYASGTHSDAIQATGGTGPITITENFVDWRTPADTIAGTNSAVIIQASGNNISSVVITDNLMFGGTSIINVSSHTTDHIVDTRIERNRFDHEQYYYLYPTNRPPDITFTDNVRHTTGAGLGL